jgi:TolB protein
VDASQHDRFPKTGAPPIGTPDRPWAVHRWPRRAALAGTSLAGLAAAGGSAGCGIDPQRLLSPPPLAPTPTADSGPRPTATATPRAAGLSISGAARTLPGRLVFVSDANLWLLERGQVRRLTADRLSRQPAWSRDGTRLAHVKLWTSGSDLWLIDADGGHPEELTSFTTRPEAQQSYALRPVWWPDGSRLIYLSEEGSQDAQLWQLTLAGRRRQRFLAPAADGLGGLDTPRLSADGLTLAVASFQPGRGPAGRSQVWTIALAGGRWRQVTEASDGAYDPDWSPDGRRLAYTARRAGRHDVWISQADGSNAYQVTTAGMCRAPAWSPDGAWLTYLSAQTGTFELWAVPAPAEGSSAGASGTSPPAGAQQLTRGALADAASGIAWAR